MTEKTLLQSLTVKGPPESPYGHKAHCQISQIIRTKSTVGLFYENVNDDYIIWFTIQNVAIDSKFYVEPPGMFSFIDFLWANFCNLIELNEKLIL